MDQKYLKLKESLNNLLEDSEMLNLRVDAIKDGKNKKESFFRIFEETKV